MPITRTSVRRLLPILLLAILAGCQSAPPAPQPFPPMGFADRGTFALGASGLEVISLYRSPLSAPNVEHEFPLSPEAAARQWARERLRIVGPSLNRAVFTIEDARVIETKLPRQQGLPGIVRDDQSERYDGVLKVELALFNGDVKVARVFVEATASRSVAESITLEGRRAAWWEMTSALMDQLDRTLDAEIRRTMAQHLR